MIFLKKITCDGIPIWTVIFECDCVFYSNGFWYDLVVFFGDVFVTVSDEISFSLKMHFIFFKSCNF